MNMNKDSCQSLMEQDYYVYGPEASYVQPYQAQPPPLAPQHQLHDMQPPIYGMHHQALNEYHKSPPMQYGHPHRPSSESGSSQGRMRYEDNIPRKRNCITPRVTIQSNKAYLTTQTEGCSLTRADSDTASGSSRKKNSEYDNETGDDTRSAKTTNEDKKQNHSEIEKRRRDKMNTYITELSSMIPMCGAMSKKLDKLTVLRMAVQHLKSVHGAVRAFPEGRFKPEFLSERELKMLILQAADGFLFVADCDTGRMIYVSESVNASLKYAQGDLLGQSLFDIMHPKDVAKVKEQLSSPDINSRERIIDAKTMLPVHTNVMIGTSRLSPGTRRSFFCRMKVNPAQYAHDKDHMMIKQEQDSQSSRSMERKYCVVHCTGYLKAWSSGEASAARESTDEDNGSSGNLSCLIAIGRMVPELPRCQPERPLTRKLQFVSRHATDGKFVYVDQRVTPSVGFLPQELLGTSIYEYVAEINMNDIARAHKAALQTRTPQSTAPYGFRRRDRTWALVQTDWRPFRNPWTKEVECLVAQNTILQLYAERPMNATDTQAETFYPRETDREMQRAISSQLESHKIGCSIADEVLRQRSSAASTPDLGHVSQDVVSYSEQGDMSGDDNSMLTSSSLPHFCQVRNNVVLSDGIQPEIDDVLRVIGTSNDSVQDNSPPDGNDEAAMAVIMSLLEADAGLGGPVDFTGLPWPLP